MTIQRNLQGLGIQSGAARAIAGTLIDGVTATGTVQADAVLISNDTTIFGTVNSGTGCILPIGDENDQYLIVNGGANALKVYPPSGGTINGGATNAAYSLPAGGNISVFYVTLNTIKVRESDEVLRADLAASSGSSLVGFIQAGAGAVARTEQAKMRDVVSVKDFGAVGDGVADDTAAIQAAIDYAASNTINTTIYLPHGIYKISHSLNLSGGTRVPSLIGAGSAETTIITDGTFGSSVPLMILQRTSIDRVANKTFRGFTLRDTAGNAYGFQLKWVTETIFDDIGLYNLAGGINCVDTVFSCEFRQVKTASPAGPSVILRDESNNLLFSNCVLSGATEGIKLLGSANAVKFQNCDFEGGSSYHVQVTPATGKVVRALSIDTCYFENGSTFSIYVLPTDADGCAGFEIVSNYFVVQPATVAAPLVLRNCTAGVVKSNTANRYTGYLYNRDGTANLLEITNNDYDAPALNNVGDADSAAVKNYTANNTTGPSVSFGFGSPEGVVAAGVGSIYTRTDGGAGTTFYVKESGSGNTGWVAK